MLTLIYFSFRILSDQSLARSVVTTTEIVKRIDQQISLNKLLVFYSKRVPWDSKCPSTVFQCIARSHHESIVPAEFLYILIAVISIQLNTYQLSFCPLVSRLSSLN